MSLLGGAPKPTTRRDFLRSAALFTAAGVFLKPALALAAGKTSDVTVAPYGASPSNADNTAAFQAALNVIAGNGGGRLYVPGGQYTLASPLTYAGGSLTVAGDGQTDAVLINTHRGTVLSATLSDNSKCLRGCLGTHAA